MRYKALIWSFYFNTDAPADDRFFLGAILLGLAPPRLRVSIDLVLVLFPVVGLGLLVGVRGSAER